ncbi:RDD family protein [Mucilaginibacter litoreus]
MEDKYYIFKNEREEGPYTLDELLQTGLDVNTMVLSPRANDWQRASDLPELFNYFEAEGYYFPTEDNLAGFGWRLLAYIADSIIISYPAGFLRPENFTDAYNRAVAGNPSMDDLSVLMQFNIISFLVVVMYHTICEFSPLQGSLGKKLFRLVVVDEDGRRLGFFRALARNAGKFISGLALMIGYLWCLWDDRKQTWHDKWSKSYVLIRNR